MKFCSLTSALISVVLVTAQNIQIGAPSPGAALHIGKPFDVQVNKPDSQGPTRSVSVVIGLQRCGLYACPASDDDKILGSILYQGNYSPLRHPNEPRQPPYQNFTFYLAANEKSQNAVVHVSHLYLLGAGPSIFLETKNVSVTFK